MTQTRMRSRSSTHKKGFTLVELMIVVAIIGVLAAIAVVGFAQYIKEAEQSEAKAFLADLKTKQDAYKSRFGYYLSTSPNPPAAPGTNNNYLENWETGGVHQAWISLGAKPGTDRVKFQYITKSGTGAAGNQCQNSADKPHPSAPCAGLDGTGAWFWASAENADWIILANSVRPSAWVLEK